MQFVLKNLDCLLAEIMGIEDKILEAFRTQNMVIEKLSEVVNDANKSMLILVNVIEKMEERIKELEQQHARI